MTGPKILTLDIETKPNVGMFFSLWKQNIGLVQVQQFSELFCFAAKWMDSRKTEFYSEWGNGRDGMLKEAFRLLSSADAVLTYNGDGFDLKILNWEFAKAEMGEPAPYQSIDLYKAVKQRFRPVSNKLDHVADQLGVGRKLHHSGFQLWMDCMNGDEKAQKLMERYNRQDVVITESAALRVRPWIKSWPNVALYMDPFEVDRLTCPLCGGHDLRKEGFRFTAMGKYQRYQCRGCGKWSSTGSATLRVALR